MLNDIHEILQTYLSLSRDNTNQFRRNQIFYRPIASDLIVFSHTIQI